jgi:DNA-binding transcriptional regulator GbsR (MarR family)
MGVGNRKCTDEQIRHLAEQGLGVAEIARRLGVTKGAISQRCRKLEIDMSLEVVSKRGLDQARSEFSPIEQIHKINEKAHAILDKLGDCVQEGKIEAKEALLALKAMKEIRSQIKLQLDVAEAFLNYESEIAFRKEVIEIIEAVEPGAKNEIIRRFKDKRSLGSLLKPY